MEEILQGKLHNSSEELRDGVAMAPTANSVSEKVFGSFDTYMREKANATTLNLESTILLETYKTFLWLNPIKPGDGGWGLFLPAANLSLNYF